MLVWRDRSADEPVAQIGDELAIARALSDLANQLFALTSSDIEAVFHQPVTRRAYKSAPLKKAVATAGMFAVDSSFDTAQGTRKANHARATRETASLQ